MPEYNEDQDRQVVPRWRTLASAIDFGELLPLATRPTGNFDEELLRDIRDDWAREPGLSVAGDLLSAAISIGCTDAVRDAANFVLSHADAPPAARDLARRCASQDFTTNQAFRTSYGLSKPQQIDDAIRKARERLRENAINPLLWTNLALFFTTRGYQQKAARAMQVALSLARTDRFVLRAACRLFLHQGDLERAHVVLLQTPILRVDPWILAGEVALSAVRKRTSLLIKRARSMLDSQNYARFHLSELAGALATIEASDGNIKRAQRLCRSSLEVPAENAIAQAAWLGRKVGGTFSDVKLPESAHSSEASAWQASASGQWETALNEAKQWQAEQPFSSRPAIFGGHVASMALEKFEEAERVLLLGLDSNRDDATLCNNLAFSQAKQGKLDDARRHLEHGQAVANNHRQQVCLTATEGLIAFRSGDIRRGHLLYRRAIQMASGESMKELRSIATIYLALEEIRIGSQEAQSLRTQGHQAAESLSSNLRPLFIGKLQKAEFGKQ